MVFYDHLQLKLKSFKLKILLITRAYNGDVVLGCIYTQEDALNVR